MKGHETSRRKALHGETSSSMSLGIPSELHCVEAPQGAGRGRGESRSHSLFVG
mgnify:CR=1 FL=1